MRIPLLLAPTAALVTAGCADPAGFPTLAPRPIEQVSLAEPAAQPGTPGVSAAAAEARFAPLLAKVREADAALHRALAEAGPVLAAGYNAPVGSDAWSAAEQRLSRLQGMRAPVAAALSTLEDAVAVPEVQADGTLAAAGARALAAARAIDADGAAAIGGAAPRRN